MEFVQPILPGVSMQKDASKSPSKVTYKKGLTQGAAHVTSLNPSVVCVYLVVKLWLNQFLSQQLEFYSKVHRCLMNKVLHLRGDVSGKAEAASWLLTPVFSLLRGWMGYDFKWANSRFLKSKIWAGWLTRQLELNILTAKGRLLVSWLVSCEWEN